MKNIIYERGNKMLKEMKINEKTTKEFFVQALKNNKLVPILGAGFSYGMPARRGKHIPSGAELKNYMIKEIRRENKQFENARLEEQSF